MQISFHKSSNRASLQKQENKSDANISLRGFMKKALQNFKKLTKKSEVKMKTYQLSCSEV